MVKDKGFVTKQYKTQHFCKHRRAPLLKFCKRQTFVDHYKHYIRSFSVHVFMQTKSQISSRPHHSPCDRLWQAHFFVLLPLYFCTKWIKTGWHLVFYCVLSNVHFPPSWPAKGLQTHWLLCLTWSFVHGVPACGSCHCGLAHGLLLCVDSSRLTRLMCVTFSLPPPHSSGGRIAREASWNRGLFASVTVVLFVCIFVSFFVTQCIVFFPWHIVKACLHGHSTD